MKFGIRTPSLTKRIAARTSLSRYVRHSVGLKAPRGWGWLTNPKKAAYNRVYSRTTVSADKALGSIVGLGIWAIVALIGGLFSLFSKPSGAATAADGCPRCGSPMVLRNGRRGQFYGCSRFPRCRGTRDFTG